MNVIDSRDLLERKEELKQQVLDSFLEEFPHYEGMTESFEDIRFQEEEIENWKEDCAAELQEITAIEELDNEVGAEFTYGISLIEEYCFKDYCEELLVDCGYLSRDFPMWIVIDWGATADNIRMDYSEVYFDGKTYLYRA